MDRSVDCNLIDRMFTWLNPVLSCVRRKSSWKGQQSWSRRCFCPGHPTSSTRPSTTPYRRPNRSRMPATRSWWAVSTWPCHQQCHHRTPSWAQRATSCPPPPQPASPSCRSRPTVSQAPAVSSSREGLNRARPQTWTTTTSTARRPARAHRRHARMRLAWPAGACTLRGPAVPRRLMRMPPRQPCRWWR